MGTPYTYLIHIRSSNQYYYGVQYNRDANPDDLGVTYFSSSKTIQMIWSCFGSSDVSFQIRKTFDDSESAIAWEHKILQKIKDGRFKSMNFINECSSPAISNEKSRIGAYRNHEVLRRTGFYKTDQWTHKKTIWVNDGKKNKRILKKGLRAYMKMNPDHKLGMCVGEK